MQGYSSGPVQQAPLAKTGVRAGCCSVTAEPGGQASMVGRAGTVETPGYSALVAQAAPALPASPHQTPASLLRATVAQAETAVF
jgi:hypothetical protein